MDFNIVITEKEIDDELFHRLLVREDLTPEELASLRDEMIWEKAGGAVLDGVLALGRLAEISHKRRLGQWGMMSKAQLELRSIIERCHWFREKASTQTTHEYIEWGICPITAEEFLFFVGKCYLHGKVERTDYSFRQYFYFDDYKYWTDRATVITIIHRTKIDKKG